MHVTLRGTQQHTLCSQLVSCTSPLYRCHGTWLTTASHYDSIPESSLGTWILGHQTKRYRSTDFQWAPQTSLQTLDSCARIEGHACPPPQGCKRNCPSAKEWCKREVIMCTNETVMVQCYTLQH